MPLNLLTASQVARYRSGDWEIGGPFEERPATGRARCRACGQRIAKGSIALFGFHDFYAIGSVAASPVWLHKTAADCGV